MHGTNHSALAPADLAKYIDHTLLKPETIEKDITRLCEEAKKHSFKAVCVNPIFVKHTRQILKDTPVLTASVIGFPLGTHCKKTKALETELAAGDGATEIDMVIRLDLVKAGKWDEVADDINSVVTAANSAIVKVILETGLLTPDEVARACRASEVAGAAFVKTATGFLGRGATVEDIVLMRKSVSDTMQIKASGGVKTFEQALAMINAGATRIGTSSGVALVTGTQAGAGY